VLIDMRASRAHYLTHMLPIWRALPDVVRGTAYAPASITGGNGTTWPWRQRPDRATLVASWQDAHDTTGPIIYMEHGAGQSYNGDDRSCGHRGYAGARDMDRVVLFLTPGPDPTSRWQATYPFTPTVEIGCPKLAWFDTDTYREAPGDPKVVLSFHWNCVVPGAPEAGSAFETYKPVLASVVAALQGAGCQVYGHWHPRASHVRIFWGQLGVDRITDPNEALLSDLLIADNSSLMYEAAMVGTPVVALNDPSWRRDVAHGLRFWGHVPGIQVDDPADVVATALWALDRPGLARQIGERAAQWAYSCSPQDGIRRAVEAITALAGAG